MPSLSPYHLTWVSLTLDMGYLFTAAPAKRNRCSLPWTKGISSPLPQAQQTSLAINIPLTNRSQITILPMSSSSSLHAHPGTFFVKILEQMSMVTLQIIFWAQQQKALCFLMLLSRTISTLTLFPANSTEDRKEQVRITRGNSFILGPCLWDEERGLGPYLHFVSNA